MPGARRRGRPRTAWMDNTKTWTMQKVRPWCGQPSDREDGYKEQNGTEQAAWRSGSSGDRRMNEVLTHVGPG